MRLITKQHFTRLLLICFVLGALGFPVRAQENNSGKERQRRAASPVATTKKVIKKTGEGAVAVGEKIDRVNGAVVETTKDVGEKTKTVALATASGAKAATKKTAETTSDVTRTTIQGTKTISRKTVQAGQKSKSVGGKIYGGMKRVGRLVKDVFTP